MGRPWKGNWNEWEEARRLSRWLTKGADQEQLIRAVGSGAWGHKNHLGDLAPNGPEGQAFLDAFVVEVKSSQSDPELWHIFSSKKFIVLSEDWWGKTYRCAVENGKIPLLITKRNRRPHLIWYPSVMPTPPTVTRSIHIAEYGLETVMLSEFLEESPDWYYANWDFSLLPPVWNAPSTQSSS